MRVSREAQIILFFGIIAIVAYARSYIALTLLTGLVFLSIPVISLIWAMMASRAIEVRREFPEEAVAGEQLFATYSFTNNSTFPAFGLQFNDVASRGFITGLDLRESSSISLRESISSLGKFFKYLGVTLLEEVDLFEESFQKTGFKAEFPLDVPPLKKGVWFTKSIPLEFPVRGKYRVGPGNLHAGDPLGIFKIPLKAHGFTEILVLPTWTSLRFFPSGGSSRILRDENVSRDKEGSSPEFLGVREYREGDPLKMVHWKLSAKHDQLMVKQFVQQVESTWGVILDLRRGYNAGKVRETSLEYMIEIAVALLDKLDDEKIPHVLALAADDITVIENLTGERTFDEELKLMAASRNDGTLNLQERAANLSENYPHVSWVIITPRRDDDIIESVRACSKFGGAVLVVNINFNSFITEDFPQDVLVKWRKIWGEESENFDNEIASLNASLCKVRRGDDLGLIFFQ